MRRFLSFHIAFFAFATLVAQTSHDVQIPDKKLIEIAKSFIGKPYVAHTLDQNDEEILVVSLTEFDCTTFVETVLALWRVGDDLSHEKLSEELTKIRYRDGKIDGFASRLHYFIDWIYDNEQRQLVRNITRDFGGILHEKKINFMTAHTDLYRQLQADSQQFSAIARCEENINRRTHYMIPKSAVAEISEKIPEGAIIAITTNTAGLDCAHVGFAVKQDGETHLLHASSQQKQIGISQKSLDDYLNSVKNFSGILIVLPLKTTN